MLGSTTDVPALRAQLEALVAAGEHAQVIAILFEILEKVTRDHSDLAARYTSMLRQMYRSKSERISPDQLALLLAQLPANETPTPPDEPPPAPEPPPGPIEGDAGAPPAGPQKPKPPKRGGRKPVPPSMRREIVKVPVPDDELRCCNAEKQLIGTRVRVTIEYRPGEAYAMEEHAEVRACAICEGNVSTAPTTPPPIEGARPGPGMLAQIVTSKNSDAVPLERQSKILARGGAPIAPSTLGDWYARAADLVEPLWHALRNDTLERYLISLDDTQLAVRDRNYARGIKRGHIWTFLGDGGEVAFCDYTPDWKGKWPQATLAAFRGQVIQSDGYAGLAPIFARPNAPRRAGCMDHCRRRFIKALEAGDARAAVVVAALREIYAVEAQARADGADLDELRLRRQRDSRPRVERLHRLIADLAGRATPKSPLGKAAAYAVNQWPTLVVFLDDPRVPLSNAHVERQQRRTAIGRRNWLFSGSDDAARRFAILHTLIVNCDLVGAPPFEYLRDVFQRLADDWPMARIRELLPAAWLADQRRQQKQPDRVADPVVDAVAAAA
ncbi:MAG: IS66 family transposase [Burkholderiales bacterium]